MDELDNYIAIDLDDYNDLRDELIILRNVYNVLYRMIHEKDSIIDDLNNKLIGIELLADGYKDGLDE